MPESDAKREMGNDDGESVLKTADAWNAFLLRQGGVFEHGELRHFGDPGSEPCGWRDRDVLMDLSSWSLVRARGPEARSFLNGQLTNDVEALDAGHSRLAAWCSAKGRMLALFRVFQYGGELHLQLPAPLHDEVLKRLRMFILRSKVVLESMDAGLAKFGLAGPTVATLLREAVNTVPEADNTCVSDGALTLLRLPGIHPRFEIVAPNAEAILLWETLRGKAAPTTSSAWAWHDIMAGIPTVLPATADAFVPQMANLELLDGVNFKKGCYPGQEIVARMQYLGRLKQRMVRAHVAASAPAPGTSIFAPDMSGQSAGTVVDAQPSPDAGSDLLAVVQISSLAAGELHLGSKTGPRLEVQPLPYSLSLDWSP